MAVGNIFQNPQKAIPKKDSQIVRISMEESEIAGRKDHLPKQSKSPDMTIKHVESQG